jgi:glycosyltransferase involved in cell wall biosynthesis
MIVLHAAGINWSRIDGPRTSVPGLVAAQNRLAGCRTALVLTAPSRGRRPELDFPVFDRKIHLGTTGRLDLPTPFDQPNLVVFHSTYLPGNAALARIVRGAGIPYIICPRGGMTRRAQRHRWWKKVLGNRLFFNSFVTHAAALHCLTRGEALESGDWRRPTFVVGNGIDLPSESELASPGSSDSLRLVFVGRLDLALKGLDLLVEACAALRTELLKR